MGIFIFRIHFFAKTIIYPSQNYFCSVVLSVFSVVLRVTKNYTEKHGEDTENHRDSTLLSFLSIKVSKPSMFSQFFDLLF